MKKEDEHLATKEERGKEASTFVVGYSLRMYLGLLFALKPPFFPSYSSFSVPFSRLSHLHRSRQDECRHGVGGDRRRRPGGVDLLRSSGPDRTGRNVLASVCPWWIDKLQREKNMKKTIAICKVTFSPSICNGNGPFKCLNNLFFNIRANGTILASKFAILKKLCIKNIFRA